MKTSINWNGAEPHCGACGSQSFTYLMWPQDRVYCSKCGVLIDAGWHEQATKDFRRWARGVLVTKRTY